MFKYRVALQDKFAKCALNMNQSCTYGMYQKWRAIQISQLLLAIVHLHSKDKSLLRIIILLLDSFREP